MNRINKIRNFPTEIFLAILGFIAIITLILLQSKLINIPLLGLTVEITSAISLFFGSLLALFVYKFSSRKVLRQKAYKSSLESKYTSEISQKNLVDIYQNFNRLDLIRRINQAKHDVYILQNWLQSFYTYQDALRDAARRGVRIKILLLHPDSSQTQRMSEEMQFVYEDEVKRSIGNSIHELTKLNKQFIDNENYLSVRLYDAIPSMSLYMIDDEIFFTTYAFGKRSMTSPYFHLIDRKDDKMFKYLMENFHDLWERGQEPGIEKVNIKIVEE